jgi:small GTP-binding protein
LKITLSLWDIAGQERFDFFKTDFYKGVTAIGLVFDLSRPDTFENIDDYFKDIRKRSGNIPIILVGNKNDLEKDVGIVIPREKIIQKVNQYHLLEYIETSALENYNVDQIFKKLSLISLLDLKPRLGQIVNPNHFRFKVLLVGDAAVGKSSLIKTFIEKKFEENYKLTVGLDLVTKDFEVLEEDLPKEVQNSIRKSIKKYRRRFRRLFRREEIPSFPTATKSMKIKQDLSEITTEKEQKIGINKKIDKKTSKKKYFYLSLIIVLIVIIILLIFYSFF